MDKKAHEIFLDFANQGESALNIMRESAYSPQEKKTLRHWGTSEAANLVGRTANRIRQQEKEGELPQPSTDTESNRRSYSLENINQMRRHFKTNPSRPKDSNACILAFANFKGGAAKTTSAVNAAQYFSLQGYKVLLIDCDSQASATQVFGYIPDDDIAADDTLLPFMIEERSSIKSQIRKTYWDSLDLIPANLSLYNIEFILPTKCNEASITGKAYPFYDLLRKGLNEVKDEYDVIILDCPPSLGMASINAVYAANAIIIPTPPAMLDFTSTVQFFQMLHDVLARLPEKFYSFVRIMITKNDGRHTSNAIITALRKLYGSFVMKNEMFSTEVIKKSSAQMRTAYEIEKYDGSKKTFDRAIEYLNAVHRELERLVKQSWGVQQ